jgi:hypothetical protein
VIDFGDFEDFAKLQVTIDGDGARAGASEVIAALRSIDAASVRTAKIMEEQLANQAQDRIAAAARRRAAEESRVSRAAIKAARDEANAKKQAAREAEQAQISAARRSEKERIKAERAVAKAARETAKEQVRAMREAEGAAGSLRSVLVAAAAGEVASGVIKTIASYESLKASLVTVEKTQAKANSTFAELQKFAAATPFTTEQATKAWIRMRAAGLEPTIDKLRAFGDASSIVAGKDVLDFVEAVADATQGGKVRLKEFGIDMDKMGSQVRLRFGDMAVTVKNDAKSIEQGLIQLTKTNFGGAMERQSKTLAGTWSTLQDNAANLAMEVGEGGLLSAMKDVVAELTATTVGGESTARSLGADLGSAVRVGADSIKFLASNLGSVKVALSALVAYKIGSWVTTVVTGFTAATAAAGGFRAAMLAAAASNPFGWIAVGVALLIELAQRWEDIVNLPGSVQTQAGNMVSGVFGKVQGLTDSFNAKYAPNKDGISAMDAEAAATAIQAHYVQKQTEKAISDYMKKNKGRLSKAYKEGDLLGTLWDDASSSIAPEAAGPKKPKAPAGLDGAKKKVDHLAESLSSLKSEAAQASGALSLLSGDPADLKQLEIENRLLEWRINLERDLRKEKKSEANIKDVVSKNEGQARENITTTVNAEHESKRIEGYRDALKGLKQEASEAQAALDLQRSGADARTIAIETETAAVVAATKARGEEADAIRAAVAAKYDAKTASEALNASEVAAQEARKQAAEDIAKAAEEAAERQADAEKAALERRKQIHEDWIGFATDGIERLGDTLTNALNGQENAWRDFFIMLAAQAASLALTQAASPGGALTGLTAGVFHEGGMVGSGGRSRRVSGSVFYGAQRYHRGGYAGLKPGEVPAILQRGERVLSRREVAQGGMRGRSNRNYSIQINLPGVQDNKGFNRSVPMLLRRLRLLTGGGRDDE